MYLSRIVLSIAYQFVVITAVKPDNFFKVRGRGLLHADSEGGGRDAALRPLREGPARAQDQGQGQPVEVGEEERPGGSARLLRGRKLHLGSARWRGTQKNVMHDLIKATRGLKK